MLNQVKKLAISGMHCTARLVVCGFYVTYYLCCPDRGNPTIISPHLEACLIRGKLKLRKYERFKVQTSSSVEGHSSCLPRTLRNGHTNHNIPGIGHERCPPSLPPSLHGSQHSHSFFQMTH